MTRTTETESVNTTTLRAAGMTNRRNARPASRALWYLFAAALALFVIGPVLAFFTRIFEDGGSAFQRLLTTPGVWTTFGTTIGLAIASTAIAAVAAVALAVLATRVPARMRTFAAIIPQIPLVIPPVAYVYGWIFLFAPDVGYGNAALRALPFLDGLESGPLNVYSIPAIILLPAVDFTGMIFAFVYPRLLEISGSVDAAARVTGASAWRSFLTISFPLLRPGLVAGMVVAFLVAIGQFTVPLFLGGRDNIKVISTEIFRIREQFPIDYPLTAVLGLPLLIFGVIAILVQRKVVGDQRKYITSGSARGISRRGSAGAAIAVIAYAVVVVALPLIAIALVAFSPFWNGDLSQYVFTTANVTETLQDPAVGQAITNSLSAALLTVLIAIPLGFLAALALSGVVQVPKAAAKVLDFIFIAPLAVPRALLGMVIIFVFMRPPFSLYGTLALFVIGYLFIALPFALRSQYSSLIGVDRSQFEAARVGGASQWRMVITIALPAARRGIAAALALAFIMLTSDFAVSAMVASPNQQVMGTLLYVLSQGGNVSAIAVMSLLMTLITALLLGISLRLGGKAALENL